MDLEMTFLWLELSLMFLMMRLTRNSGWFSPIMKNVLHASMLRSELPINHHHQFDHILRLFAVKWWETKSKICSHKTNRNSSNDENILQLESGIRLQFDDVTVGLMPVCKVILGRWIGGGLQLTIERSYWHLVPVLAQFMALRTMQNK